MATRVISTFKAVGVQKQPSGLVVGHFTKGRVFRLKKREVDGKLSLVPGG